MRETDGDPKKLRNYAGCEFQPISIYNPDQGDVPILILFPPAPLHLLLGTGNDALKCMEVIWTDTEVMQDFYKFNSYKKGNTTGGDFTGKVLREIISPASLEQLGLMLGEQGAA